ncbi:hypothetical protein C7974DRAFT_371236 [Boeremia exigua]|uniref:uncharacterized protein n=1 Tax=Boeremia exigua TaxID=749465 RepID=UPI001E8CC392|nr:uncharacterized protein C7974DRAFT_371236 [Boeremia exigua]KAH6644080.1 hypothetical protein C7974DRAFT_371236 [Boeremia exigua]
MAPFKVAVYLYPAADILDFSGPVEIYSMRPASGDAIFEVKTFGHHERITSESGTMVYVPNGTFEQLEADLQDYDVLVIPGAQFEVFDKLLPSKEGKELTALLRKFTSLPPRQEAGTRILQSVCTGTFILAASGVLAGRTITTHHMGFEELKKWADYAAGGDSKVNIVRKRWVDAGTTEAKVRIINGAGVSSGIDTSLWIYEQLAGKEPADFVAEIAEFERRGEAWGFEPEAGRTEFTTNICNMPRLGSKKSRHGCKQCKARRVKCDENRPCGACAKYRVECSLLEGSLSERADVSRTPSAGSPNGDTMDTSTTASASPPAASATPSLTFNHHYDHLLTCPEATSGGWMPDLELMHHYTAHAYMTMPGPEMSKQIWGYAVPQEGFKHPYLMHSILSFSANHLAYINIPRAQHYRMLASTHQTAALTGLNRALADLGPANCHALFASASLTIMNAFADTQTHSREALVDIFQLLRGMSFVLNTAVPWIENGPFAAIVRSANGDSKPTALLSSFLVEVQAAGCPDPNESPESQASRIKAADELREALQYSIETSGHAALRAAMTWPTKITAEILEVIKEGSDAKVLDLMRLYCRLLELASIECWFLTGASIHEDDSAKAKRAHQACLNCRKRKSRCLLDEQGTIPCLRCKRDNLECVLGGSNRGGRRVRKKRIDSDAAGPGLPSLAATGPDDGSFHSLGNLGTWSHDASHDAAAAQQYGEHPHAAGSDSSNTDELAFNNLQNPSDALGILAQVAGETSSNEESNAAINSSSAGAAAVVAGPLAMHAPPLSFSYPLLDRGVLTVHSLCQLLVRYQQNYHPFYPLAPVHAFDTARMSDMVRKEPHLLTAILLIASKDLVNEPHIYEACTEHMKALVANLAAGGDAGIEAVEALLLLAEWAPYTQLGSAKVGKGEEDKESWMHVGIALRIAYFLALDKYSFRFVDKDKDSQQHNRKRLIWTAAYVSDRHISIRIGKAFWSRGPGPLTTLRREDYPSLIPTSPNIEDYASIFQANLELTQLFSNVHDTLYSNPGASFRSNMSGSYIKFIDDFRSAIYGWKSVWGTLTCSPPLKACLLMSYDYLRLYTNAFAFQATVLRALPSASNSSEPQSSSTNLGPQAPQRVFVNNVGAVGDARFIYEGLDAAKAILTTVNNFVSPETSLRFMPLRYFLYLVHAGVFLYRARCTGVISGDEDRAIRNMIQETISRMQRSAVGVEAGIQHPGSRYSQLLKLLWAKVPRKDKSSRSAFRHPGTSVASNAVDHNGFPVPPPTGTTAQSPRTSSVGTGESPALTEQMGDFGWTDLSAVSDFAMHGNNGIPADESALWNGFLPLDLGWSANGFSLDGVGWEGGNDLGMLF